MGYGKYITTKVDEDGSGVEIKVRLREFLHGQQISFTTARHEVNLAVAEAMNQAMVALTSGGPKTDTDYHFPNDRTMIHDLDMLRKNLREADDGVMIPLSSVQYHLEILIDYGFVTGSDFLVDGDKFMPDPLNRKGKELLDVIEDDEAWKAIKEISSRRSGASVSVTQFEKIVKEVKESLSKKKFAPEDGAARLKNPPPKQEFGY